jgi:hypothetical protein
MGSQSGLGFRHYIYALKRREMGLFVHLDGFVFKKTGVNVGWLASGTGFAEVSDRRRPVEQIKKRPLFDWFENINEVLEEISEKSGQRLVFSFFNGLIFEHSPDGSQ